MVEGKQLKINSNTNCNRLLRYNIRNVVLQAGIEIHLQLKRQGQIKTQIYTIKPDHRGKLLRIKIQLSSLTAATVAVQAHLQSLFMNQFSHSLRPCSVQSFENWYDM
jgi:hypothetical protein